MTTPLPVDAALPALLAALAAGPAAVLAAPPGAGKTTRVPPALAGAPWAGGGRIVMLEPRRVAARAAAERIAAETGARLGGAVGYRMRGDTKVSRETRIEVVTEGVLTRMLQADPALEGVAAVVFDEVHERSLQGDLGLALAIEAQGALRPDLRLVAMSATLDTARFAALLGDAPVIESAGLLHPVETAHLDRPLLAPRSRARFEDAVADRVAGALDAHPGDALAFLPGAGEIARVAERLAPLVPGVAVVPLHGRLPFARQRAALAADPQGRRRVVLATAIAETSLTVEGVRLVVDAGRARRAETDPATGMGRLVTRPVSRAEADQRRGRAGRLGPGVCVRLWTKGEEGALPVEAPAEILTADLAGLALELAVWGVDDPATLPFPDPPPAPAMAEARALLARLGALDAAGGATAHGRAMARFPAHPRLAHMVLTAAGEGRGRLAARLAALAEARDPLGRADVAEALKALAEPARAAREGADRAALERVEAEARRLADAAGAGRDEPAPAAEAGAWLALAFPDRVGLRRPGEAPRYLLANGRGAALDEGSPLAGSRLIVALDVEDRGADARVRRAAALSEADLRERFAGAVGREDVAEWSRREGRVVVEARERLGALVLDRRARRDADPEAVGRALCAGLRAEGADRFRALMPFPPAALGLVERVGWLRRQGGALAGRLPAMDDETLLAEAEDWLLPFLTGERAPGEIAPATLAAALAARLGEAAAEVERAAPAAYEPPLGGARAIDYARETPTLTIRVQELFGETRHPAVGEPPVALVLELTSPAGRPVQTTRDLPGFWANSYAEVAKEMRARYPKHPWPDDPASAAPTRRAKGRGRRDAS